MYQVISKMLATVIFLQLLHNSGVVTNEVRYGSSSPFGKIIYDVTVPINSILLKEKPAEFIKNIKTHEIFGLNESKKISPVLLYATDCVLFNFDYCTSEIRAVVHILNATVGVGPANLIVSLTLDAATAIHLDTNNTGAKIDLSDLPISILYNLKEGTTCEELEKLKINIRSIKQIMNVWISPNPSSKVGYGYTESFSSCTDRKMREAISSADYLVLNMQFGLTIGVTESFGLFEKRMNYLHEENIKFIERKLKFYPQGKFPKKTIATVYYPTPFSVGEEGHRRLLLSHVEMWNSGESSVIVQAPYFDAPPQEKFSLIAYVESRSCGVSPEISWKGDNIITNLNWYSPSGLASISQHFDTFLLPYDQFRILNTQKMGKLDHKSKSPASYLNIRTILDFSVDSHSQHLDIMNQSCSPNWALVEKELKLWQSDPIKFVVPKSLVFQIVESSLQNLTIDSNLDFVQRVSPSFTIGCAYADESMLFEIYPESLVKACQSIGGTFYLLKYILYIEPLFHTGDDNLFFEDDVRVELAGLEKIRENLIQIQPEASVYLQLNVASTWQELTINPNFHATVFCNSAVLQANLYYEAILNWVKLQNFPLILKPVFENSYSPNVRSWMSFLRPIGLSNNTHHIAVIYPLFVLRNYPNGINNWTVDPCIEWTKTRPEIQADLFYNQHIGAIFHLKSDPIENQKDSNEIMLQYVFNRFHVVEITVEFGDTSIINAVFDKSSIKDFMDSKIFICYRFDDTKGKEDLASDAKFKRGILKNNTSFIKGVHLDLSNVLITNDVSYSFDAKTLQRANLFLDEVNQETDNVGIMLNATLCMDLVHVFLDQIMSPATQILGLLNKTNYVVCHDELEVITQDDLTYLGQLFDTHLYLKRIYQEFVPKIKLYFHLDLRVQLDENQEVMSKYLILLSHFQKFSSAYEIQYFLVKAFDEEFGESKNGWWAIKDFSNLNDPYAYVEKGTVYSNQTMWYAPTPAKIDIRTISKTSKQVIIIASVASIVLILVLTLFGTCFFLRYRKLSKYLSDEEVKEFLTGRKLLSLRGNRGEDGTNAIALAIAETAKFHPDNDLSIRDLNIDTRNVLGTGNFGIVYNGLAKGRPAAIKTPNNDCSRATFKTILSEVKVLSYVGIGQHQHIVEFLGAYIKEIRNGVLYIATLLCSNGTLESFLRRKKNIATRQAGISRETGESGNLIELYDLHRFSKEIASGMEYIAEMRVIHGDLSSRNVFLDDNFTCKIGDFGLSRKLYEYQEYVKKSEEPIPWKWMAYESLTKMEFTPKSDVWSYGVVLWEIYSLGCIPYGGTNWNENFENDLRQGLRLSLPQFATDEIYSRMLTCWNIDAQQRPTFSEMVEFFKPFCYSEYSVVETKV